MFIELLMYYKIVHGNIEMFAEIQGYSFFQDVSKNGVGSGNSICAICDMIYF